MAQLTKHFKSEEFECKCGQCGFDNINLELVAVLEHLREVYHHPIKINSGCRCYDHNKAVGGEEKSKHMQGIAVDFVIEGMSPAKVYQYLNSRFPDKYGIGEYRSWVHLDVRKGTPARWRKV